MNRQRFKNLSPANFAFVMSTGVLSVVLERTGWSSLSHLFLIIGLIGYAVLIFLFAVRLIVLKSDILNDLKNIQVMFKYLTFAAGTNALAVSLCISQYNLPALFLGSIGIISTLLLTYTLFCTLFFHVQAPIQAISPFWLLLAIACNSSGIAITSLWENSLLTQPAFLLLAFCFWTFGVFMYLIFMTLNIYRMMFFPFVGRDMDPCYWTCMGAAAIAVVDGGQFVILHNPPLFINTLKPFIEGMILFLWGWGTAWIPILCLMELWKAFYFKVPFHYQPSLWAMVFPLGMYTSAVHHLSSILHVDILQPIVSIGVWITFFMWCLVAFMSRLNPFAGSLSYSNEPSNMPKAQ